MKKMLYFIPPVLTAAAGGVIGICIQDPMNILCLALLLALPMLFSGWLLAKGRWWGAVPGMLLGVWLAFQESAIFSCFGIGIALVIFYSLCALFQPACLAWLKRSKKQLGWTAGLLLAAGLLWICNEMLGNPVSYLLAKNTAEKYLAKTYPNTDFVMDEFGYDFKDGGYYAHIASPSSQDTRFSIMVDRLGKFRWDSYEDRVQSRWNTFQRLEQEYSKQVCAAFGGEFPYEVELCSGSLEIARQEEKPEGFPEDGPAVEDLLLDQSAETVSELAEKSGRITIWLRSDQRDPELAAEMLLAVRKTLDEAGVPFCRLDFVQRLPQPGQELSFQGLRRQEITEEELIKKIKEAVE